jgi:hypothetical protein
MERKCGSALNVEKPVYVCVVPLADPKLCPIVHIAAALSVSLSRNREEGSEMELDPAYELFAESFTHKPGRGAGGLVSAPALPESPPGGSWAACCAISALTRSSAATHCAGNSAALVSCLSVSRVGFKREACNT